MLDSTRRAPERGASLRDERLLLCRACEAEVARTDDRVTIGAGDLHTFVNPQGQVFELVCLDRADGAVALGEPTLAYTWFPGYAWCYAYCLRCTRQLGWYFDGQAGGFWGLDRAALLEPRA